MRSLYLLRHAKSSWDDPTQADHDRPLSGRGRAAVKLMARHLERTAVRPVLVLCSSARRARQTLEAIRPALGDGAEVIVEDGLYGAEVSELVERLRRAPDGVPSIMIVAHNPGLQELAIHLAGDGDDAALRQLRTKYPTGALATLDLGERAWESLAPGQAYLVSLVTPKELA